MVLLPKMQSLLLFFFFFFFFLAFAGFLNAQKAGFLSIDCGIPQGSNYTDDYTGIFYLSDADFIDAGENKEIQAEFKDASLTRQFHNVRSFPEGDRNCYTLRPVVMGSKYLVRGSFMYGNYDGKDEMPNFDLYLGVNLWKSINQANASRPGWTEIILMATADYIPVCLVKKTGNPYISALELRLIDSAMYNATDDESTALVLHSRYDLGSTTGRILRNLSGNQLNGSVPPALHQRAQFGSLQLSIDNNPYLCTSDPCNNSGLCTTNPCELKKKKKEKTGQTVVVVAVVVSLVTVALLVMAFIYWRKHGNKKPQATTSSSNDNEVGGAFKLEIQRFTFAEIVSMTNNFQRTLGKGGFGVVYHGQMNDGTQVAVKMVSQTGQGSNEFQIEAQLLMRVYHRNLVQFIGYCAEDNKMALILEYMSEGNLANVLSESNQNPLNWEQRLRIALDIAQGLEYLHKGCKPPIIHRDVKGTNILLNEKLEAKIADFGLSKVFHNDDFTHVSTAVKGTRGYLDPEYCITNNLNEKSDVYSFGIVLMELITGQPALIQTSDSERISIIDWVRPLISRGDIGNVVDKRLQGIYDTNSAWKVIETAIACTPHKSTQRPTMSIVVAELKACMEVNQRVVSNSVSFASEGYLSQGTDNSIFRPTPR